MHQQVANIQQVRGHRAQPGRMGARKGLKPLFRSCSDSVRTCLSLFGVRTGRFSVFGVRRFSFGDTTDTRNQERSFSRGGVVRLSPLLAITGATEYSLGLAALAAADAAADAAAAAP